MSELSEDQALQIGHDCAMAAVASQKDELAVLSPGDRLQWWIGFLSAGMGAAQASVGERAFRALRRSLADDLETEMEHAMLAVVRRLQGGTDTTSSFEFPQKKT
jgi:hypothetical protein